MADAPADGSRGRGDPLLHAGLFRFPIPRKPDIEEELEKQIHQSRGLFDQVDPLEELPLPVDLFPVAFRERRQFQGLEVEPVRLEGEFPFRLVVGDAEARRRDLLSLPQGLLALLEVGVQPLTDDRFGILPVSRFQDQAPTKTTSLSPAPGIRIIPFLSSLLNQSQVRNSRPTVRGSMPGGRGRALPGSASPPCAVGPAVGACASHGHTRG